MEIRWDYTWKCNRMTERGVYYLNGLPHYKGRPLISRDTPIDGGVFYVGFGIDAIVVDSQKSKKLREFYEKTKKRFKKQKFKLTELGVLGAVYESVVDAFPNAGNENLEKFLADKKYHEGQKINLEMFLEYGIGVCRHMALASGYLLEKFKQEGIINGKISVDRNADEVFGHAWCRYTTFSGEVFILDASLNYYGILESSDLMQNKKKWDYFRPEDKSIIR